MRARTPALNGRNNHLLPTSLFASCRPADSPRPEVTQLRWPGWYSLPASPVLEQSGLGRRTQAAWQGADVNVECAGTPLPRGCVSGGRTASLPDGRRLEGSRKLGRSGKANDRPGKGGKGKGATAVKAGKRKMGFSSARQGRAPILFGSAGAGGDGGSEGQEEPAAESMPVERTLFAQVAHDVAARSFNSREVVLTVSDGGGLPMAVNLAASLVQVGVRHLLILGADQTTCSLLHEPDAPSCVWSSLLRREGTPSCLRGPIVRVMRTAPRLDLTWLILTWQAIVAGSMPTVCARFS